MLRHILNAIIRQAPAIAEPREILGIFGRVSAIRGAPERSKDQELEASPLIGKAEVLLGCAEVPAACRLGFSWYQKTCTLMSTRIVAD